MLTSFQGSTYFLRLEPGNEGGDLVIGHNLVRDHADQGTDGESRPLLNQLSARKTRQVGLQRGSDLVGFDIGCPVAPDEAFAHWHRPFRHLAPLSSAARTWASSGRKYCHSCLASGHEFYRLDDFLGSGDMDLLQIEANGTGWCCGVTRRIGALSVSNRCSGPMAEMSGVMPQQCSAPSTIARRLVFLTVSRIASLSRGEVERGAITSQSTPSSWASFRQTEPCARRLR